VIDETINELHYFSQVLPDVCIATVYVGGGTPSIVERKLLAKLFSAIHAVAKNPLFEWSVEANPESMDREFLLLCMEYGVTRISIGVQTLRDQCLRILGRRCSKADIIGAADLLRKYWQGTISIDLLCGIPGQTISYLKEDIAYCLEIFHPHHVSLYSLTLEEQTTLKRLVEDQKISMPSEEFHDELWFYGYRLLEENGFLNYEISNFCRPRYECSHNLRYWLLEPYIGIGPAAVSTLCEEKGRVVRIHQPESISQFLQGEKAYWGMDVEEITGKEFLLEHCMMGFRLKNGFPINHIVQRFGRPLPDFVPELWKRWVEHRYIRKIPGRYALTDRSRYMLDTLLIELAREIDRIPEIKTFWP
jgi:oxygen-independent coproporphyrinogen-3 oxidase